MTHQTAIILHGMPDKQEYFDSQIPSESNRHWLPWLQKQLNLQNILTQTPEFPDPYKPDYAQWCSIFEQYLVNENTLLVSYSCGGGFLIRWLSEHQIRVGKVVLVAPWIDPDRTDTTDFFYFKIDAALPERTKGVDILVSNNDYADVLKSVKQIINILPKINVITLPGKKHFTINDLKTEQFPELLDICLN